MISWTKLLTGQLEDNDNLRYSKGKGAIPKLVVWNSTSGCNLYCQHCYFDARQAAGPNELSQKEAEDFILDLAKLEVSVLLFSGGEPLVRKDIFELGRFAKASGIQPVLSTNGTLITKGIAEKIKKAGFSYVGISLDGMEQTNDAFRQKKGAFKAAVAAIKNCQRAGLKVGLRFTVVRSNFKDLPAIFDLVEKQSIPRFCLYHLVYTGRAGNIIQNDISYEEKRQMLEFIWEKTTTLYQKGKKIEILTVDNHADGAWVYLKLKSHNPGRAKEALRLLKAQGGNSSGIKIGAVDNQGYIYADQFLRSYPLGNIRQERFSDLWRGGNGLLSALRSRKDFLKGRCQRCDFLNICNGNFRARAAAFSGDLWAEDPACYLTEKEIAA